MFASVCSCLAMVSSVSVSDQARRQNMSLTSEQKPNRGIPKRESASADSYFVSKKVTAPVSKV